MLESAALNAIIFVTILVVNSVYVYRRVFAPINTKRKEPSNLVTLFVVFGVTLLFLPISNGLGTWQLLGQILTGQANW